LKDMISFIDWIYSLNIIQWLIFLSYVMFEDLWDIFWNVVKGKQL